MYFSYYIYTVENFNHHRHYMLLRYNTTALPVYAEGMAGKTKQIINKISTNNKIKFSGIILINPFPE